MIGEIILPWPSRKLHPNSRHHWSGKAAATRKARKDAYYATLEKGLSKLDLEALKATVVFHPPDNRRRDADGVLSSCKAYLDGISDAIGVDDSQWSLAIERGAPVQFGRIRIVLDVVQ